MNFDAAERSTTIAAKYDGEDLSPVEQAPATVKVLQALAVTSGA